MQQSVHFKANLASGDHINCLHIFSAAVFVNFARVPQKKKSAKYIENKTWECINPAKT